MHNKDNELIIKFDIFFWVVRIDKFLEIGDQAKPAPLGLILCENISMDTRFQIYTFLFWLQYKKV